MKDLFDFIYCFTKNFYGDNLDSYLYDNSGYLHVGFIMLILSFVASYFFYYLAKPVRKQTSIWFFVMAVCGIVNLIIATWYSYSPIAHNAIDDSASWSFLDSIFLGVANAIWSCVFYVVAALCIKWGSVCKYVPFKKF